MTIEHATEAERIAVKDLMLAALESARAECGMHAGDPFLDKIRKAAEAVPSLGDEFYRVNPEIKAAADILLRVVRVSPNASPSATTEDQR